jgi:hypothetical protein
MRTKLLFYESFTVTFFFSTIYLLILFIDRFKSRLFKNLTFLTAPVKKTIEAHCFSDKKKE